MNNKQNLETQIRAAVGTAPAADFDSWQSEHADAFRALGNGASSHGDESRSRLTLQHWGLPITGAATIGVIALLAWVFLPRESVFAETIRGINEAKAITWVRTTYECMTSKDEKRRWLVRKHEKCSYLHPGFYRRDLHDEDGNLLRTRILDPIRGQSLMIDMKGRRFRFEEYMPSKGKEADGERKPSAGPFNWLNRGLKEGGEIVGQRQVDGREVDVLRWRNKAMGIHNPRSVTDVWIDAQTDQLIGVSHPGSSLFEPEKLEYRNNPAEESFSSGKFLGSIENQIVLDAEVDPSIFKLDVPEGFTKAEPRKPPAVVTEDELIEWLQILAKVNDDQFVDGVLIRNTKKIAEAQRDPNKTDSAKEMGEIWRRHMMKGNTMPLWDFVEANTFAKDHRYLGKGVKLGSKKELVLLYRLKLTGKYRGVYGDLRIEDITDAEANRIQEASGGKE